MTDLTKTLHERGSRYSSFKNSAILMQGLKAQMQCVPSWDKLSKDKREALEMIMRKVGRILNGDPNYADSWVDIAGYAQLIVDTLDHDS